MAQLDVLRATLRRPENINPHIHEVLPFGVAEIDRKLLGGGLAFGCVHEVSGASAGMADANAAMLFVAAALGRSKGKILWCAPERDLFAPSLEQVGLDMTRVIFVEAGDEKKVLARMEEGLRQGGVTAVVGEISKLTMNESRRLQLAAEQSGAMGVVLRRQWKSGEAGAASEPTVSRTRWSVSAEQQRRGEMRWQLELMRCRAGQNHVFEVEGCDEEGRLVMPTVLPYPVAPQCYLHAVQ